MKKDDFEEKVKDLGLNKAEKFKIEQINELIESINTLKNTWSLR